MVEACCATEEAGMDGAELGGGRWKKLHNRRHTPVRVVRYLLSR